MKFTGFSNEIPFTASLGDPEPHGRELYERAQTGEFGPIAPYVAPQELDNTYEMSIVQAKIALLIAAKELGAATEEELDCLTLLRRKLVRLYRAGQVMWASNCSGLIIPDTILGGTVATKIRGVQ